MKFAKKNGWGILICLMISIPSYLLGKLFPVIGGAVIAIIAGMIISRFIKNRTIFENGIKFTSKNILHWAVILLGFGLNLNVILETGVESLPIITGTISTSLIVSFILHKSMRIPVKISTLVGVGSSICGGSAIAAAAPVIKSNDEEVAQAMSVIFFYNVIAALLFPLFGDAIGFSHLSGDAFGVFAGTAINDTSSVTAAATTWDSMWNLGSQTIDKAVTVKLTRTLAIIPISLGLAFIEAHKEKKKGAETFSFRKIFPFFILYFIAASIITTISVNFGADPSIFNPAKVMSKFLIVMAMSAIGLNTDIVKLIKTGGKPIILGGCCWVSITAVSLAMQHIMGIW